MATMGNIHESTTRIPKQCDVLVAGAGPVGMLLALMLKKKGISVVVVDPREGISQHSRAIGIHPPGLFTLDSVGLADTFVARGKIVGGGWAYVDGRPVGRMGFESNPGTWRNPLVMPQHMTEEILESSLRGEHVPLLMGWKYQRHQSFEQNVSVDLMHPEHGLETLECSLLVGCDGKRSEVRSAMGSRLRGGKYPDRYMMGDFKEDGRFGDDAIINLHHDGMVESFPLPGGKRRWVARIHPKNIGEPSFRLLAEMATARMSTDLALEGCTMFSTFGIERWRADTLVAGRVALAGDAAHVVSPIGGQGMNLGWMDAFDLATGIGSLDSVRKSKSLAQVLQAYETAVQKRAKVGIRRAWFNTMMGRPGLPSPMKRAMAHVIVNTGMRRVFARRFTMADL